jgi:hypothetical protein
LGLHRRLTVKCLQQRTQRRSRPRSHSLVLGGPVRVAERLLVDLDVQRICSCQQVRRPKEKEAATRQLVILER